jgi:hypothetical protein
MTLEEQIEAHLGCMRLRKLAGSNACELEIDTALGRLHSRRRQTTPTEGAGAIWPRSGNQEQHSYEEQK